MTKDTDGCLVILKKSLKSYLQGEPTTKYTDGCNLKSYIQGGLTTEDTEMDAQSLKKSQVLPTGGTNN